ncbi:RNA-guided endonuclease TnpB family protein [Nitrosococcus halophilus]|nr:RNA-guided endonuclease TnpB family protein [Nitrosococcus halophilus]
MMKRAYQERFYPTAEQADLLARSFGCARFVWNNTLKHRTDAFYQNGEVIPHWALEKRLVQLKQDFSWLNEVSSVTSDGFKSGNPKYTEQYEAKLAYLQRKLAKKRKGSRNRNKLRLKVARVHTKIADCRRDATHKASRTLINENQVVCVESLAVKNMIKHPRLAKPIADAHWGEFVRQLKYKAQWVGRTVVEIDRGFPSSKRCPTPGCGHINKMLPLEVREWSCPSCGTVHDRDIAAAINIKTAGLAGLASGATGTGATTGVVA